MAKTKKENPNHHMGKETGYELIDGVYHIAPMYSEHFDTLNYREQGIKNMLNAVTEHLGLDTSKRYVYQRGTLREIPEDKPLEVKQEVKA